jgi:UDP-N-acetylmuramyl pentapeptide phosphotransferase/UDP-N-acetylglucosamine-1-phosphate transferase
VKGVALLAFLLTLGLTPVVIFLLRRLHVIDVPTERSSHVEQTPRGGGAAVLVGAVSAMVLGWIAGVPESGSLKTLLVCASFFAIVGLIDDIRTLDVKPRLAAQLACAVAFVGPWFFQNGPMSGLGVRMVLAIAAVVWVMGYLNAFNFMDGINGISGLHAALAGVVFAFLGHHLHTRIVELCGVAIAAASLGFLPFNFPRARVFLGDIGSYFIGTWIAISALIALVWGAPVEAVFAPLAVYLADTSFTLVSRIRRGADWRRSHHEHIYQQLIDRGWSHTRTALTVLSFSIACASLGLVSLRSSWILRIGADLLIVVMVTGYLALPRLLNAMASSGKARTAVGGVPASARPAR